MKITVAGNADLLGRAAAGEGARLLREAIARDGYARVVLSTGASQFTTLKALVAEPDIDWAKVEMFHLDEYVGLPATHKASFRKYLRERFVEPSGVGQYHFVDGTAECVRTLTALLREKPVQVGLIGIGRNGHIAFNDPPADFDTREAYIFVTLDDACKRQQVAEGWFATPDDVPRQAVSMTPWQIMQCRAIITAVPYAEKADAIRKTLESPLTNEVPATLLKTHPSFSLFVDEDSFKDVDVSKIVCLREGEGYGLSRFI